MSTSENRAQSAYGTSADAAPTLFSQSDTEGFLAQLAALDIRLEPDGEHVRCDAPKGALSASLRVELTRRKSEIVQHLRRRARHSSALTQAPLASAQRRLWFLQQLEPDSPAYNLGAAFRVRGKFDRSIFQRVIQTIVTRHDVLRTHIELHEGVPLQVVAPNLDVAIPIDDLSRLPVAERHRRLTEEVTSELRRPFDLEHGPLIRAREFYLAEDDSVLTLTLHHIVADGWSIGVFMGELAVLYGAYQRGEGSSLPPLSSQYLDFAIQQQQSDPQHAAARLAYWTAQLAGLPPVLELATDRPRPATRGQSGGVYYFEISSELAARVRALSRAHSATPFMVLFACFAVLLRIHSGADDLAIGVPFANRSRRDLEPLIGFFVDTLVLRADLRDNPSFLELLARVRAVTLEAHSHQDMPFDRLVEALQPERSASHQPIFQVLFGMQSQPKRSVSIPGLELEFLPLRETASKSDLGLFVNDDGDGQGFSASFEFDCDLFDIDTVARLVTRLQTLLADACHNPTLKIFALNCLADDERECLAHWSGKRVPAASPANSLYSSFAAQAARTPHAVAVSRGTRQLSFAGVRAGARRIAACLLDLGLQPESRVAVCLPRDIELPVALLGIVAAGAAYVPIDRNHPAQRRANIIKQAGVSFVVTDQTWLETARAELPPGAQLICVEDLLQPRPELPDRALPSVDPEQLAYLIFTSGSTGEPKGVAVTHRSVSAFLASMRDDSDITERDAVLFGTSLAFDVSVFELFLPLCAGGRVVCADNVLSVIDLPEGPFLTLLSTVPSAAAELSRQGLLPSSLRAAYLAGEALSCGLADELFTHLPGLRLKDGYGPTECTVYATVGQRALGGPKTIGAPVLGSTAFVVDPRGQCVGVGLPGELWLGGAGLARGYFGRPAWTAERFIPDAFGDQPGARLYRTGDLVRFSRRGDLEFIGRIDHQVKLRGFRIELEEIEAALLSQPGVRDACVSVVLRNDEPRLAAYVCMSPNAATDELALQALLAVRLPHYMVPSEFVFLDSLPLNSNGKIDRTALRKLSPVAEQHGCRAVELETPEETLVATVWAGLLGVHGIGPGDDFFALGGHSLLALRMLAALKARCEVNCSLREFFANSTVRGIARRIRIVGVAETQRIMPQPVAASYPLSFTQERFWFLSQLEGGPNYLLPLCLAVDGVLRVPALRQALQHIVDRHELLRCAFLASDGSPIASPRADACLSCPLEDLSALPEDEQRLALARFQRLEAETPLDTSSPPLLRARLLRMADERHFLLLTLHHLICDGLSVKLFLDELSLAYRHLAAGEKPNLPELPIQYSDYARWQRSSLTDVLAKQEQAWQVRLAGAPALLALPFDHPHPRTPNYRGATVALEVPSDCVEKLRALAQGALASTFMVGLAAYAVLLERYCGQQDIVIGTPTAGREREELFPLIGCFVNTLAIRLRPQAQKSFRRLLEETREAVLEALEHGDYPFEKLIARLSLSRVPGRAPLVQTMFVLQSPFEPKQLSDDLRSSLIGVPSVEAKFDLTVCLAETGVTGLRGYFEYNADVFEHDSVVRMATDFVSVLQSVAEHPDCALANPAWEPGMVSLAHGGAPAQTPALPGECAHSAFEHWARRTPAAIAAVYRTRHWTYGELDRRAESVARVLRSRGVGPESIVALCAEPSLEVLAGILGILKAGGAYLPLDPSYPANRLAYMLERARASVVLAAAAGADRFPDWDVISLDDASADKLPPRPTSGEPSPARPCPANLAYVIFTSGSTGRPKGIELSHAGLSNLIAAQKAGFALGPAARVLQFASLSFDASIPELFTTLSAGGTLILESGALRLPGRELRELMLKESITTATLPPSILALMPAEPMPALETLIVAGEQCTESVMHSWLVGRRFINAYGPSEVTVCATLGALSATDRAACIGRPIDGASVQVRDHWGRLAPVGVEGDLLLGGPGLARGYLRDPARTAEAFQPDAAGEPGSRVYFSGDRARQLPDQRLEFCGRRDGQIKLRGCRIEPGEIQALLNGHPSTRGAVVTVREDRPGDRRLSAYVLLSPADAPLEPLWQLMRNQLPAFLVPSSLVAVAEWPLTTSGKIDRRALSSLKSVSRSRVTGTEAPRDDVEQRLAALWRTTLGLEAIGIHDDFFESGGHSLLAIVLVEAIRRDFGPFRLSAFLAEPTIAATADSLRTEAASPGAVRALIQLAPGQGGPPWILVHGADGRVVRFRTLARLLGVERPVYALQAPGAEHGSVALPSIEALVELYLGELSEAAPQGVAGVIGFSAGGAVAFELARRLRAAGKPTGKLVLLDSLAPGRMRLPEDERVLLLDYVRSLGTTSSSDLGATLPADARENLLEELTPLNLPERMDKLRGFAAGRGLVIAEQDRAALERSFRLFLELSRAAARFVPDIYSGESVVLRATRGAARLERDPLLGWGGHLSSVSSFELQCEHEALLNEPHVSSLCEILNAGLAWTPPRSASSSFREFNEEEEK